MAAAPALSLRRYSGALDSHSHDHFQVLLGLSGTLELDIDGRGARVGPGEGRVIAPGARHSFAAPRGSVCLVLDSTQADWIERPSELAAAGRALSLAQYLASAVQAGLPLAAAYGPALLLEAWGNARDHTPLCAAPRRAIDWDALTVWAMREWHRPLAVADLAARVHLGSSQFAERCREEQGQSPMAWLRTLRLRHAQLLRASGMPVNEAARRAGYRSPSALTAALRRQGHSAHVTASD